MTTLAFDTSFMVAALVQPHPRHERCQPWLHALHAGEVCGELSTHALAETWAVLTRLPIDPPISPATATLALERVQQLMSVAELSRTHYRDALQRCAECAVTSGAVFDALHLVCAEHTGATAFVTFNARDFERLAGPKSPPIVVPPDPPSLAIPSPRP